MPKAIDDLLNRTTMYRLLVYYLGGLLAIAAAFSAAGLLPYDPVNMIAQAGFLVAVSWLSNAIFARIWKVPANAESSLITALILALITAPGTPGASFFVLLFVALSAMASKYLLAIRGKHVFNPAAFGAAAIAIVLNRPAIWWIGGNLPMLPFVLFGGVLVVRKIRRSDLVLAFLGSALASYLAFTTFSPGGVAGALFTILARTPLLFFAFVMITEPLTTPPRRIGRILYGLFTGLLFAPWAHLGSFYFTPEIALLCGNVFSYLASPKWKALLELKAIRKIAGDTYEFAFAGPLPAFRPGQYAEWTLAADSSDSRGNRRYFTLASSPTEKDARLGIKFYQNPSTYKIGLAEFRKGNRILAGNIAGDFTLPRRTSRKLAFIAGGIGATPFRSMAKYLLDRREKRDVMLLYSNRTEADIAYKDVFDAAELAGIGFRAVYTLTDEAAPGWRGRRGRVDAAMIRSEIPDFRERAFYLSGPPSLVDAFKKTLREMGVPRFRIKSDYFPGLA